MLQPPEPTRRQPVAASTGSAAPLGRRPGGATLKEPRKDGNDASRFRATTPAEAINSLLTNVQVSFQYSLPFPEYPSVPLLYPPPVLQEAFDFPRGVSALDIEVMSTGLVEAIPLCPPPVTLAAHQKLSAVAEATRQHAVALDKIYYTAQEANPLLTDEDFQLVDTDLDRSILESRNLPNLRSLMKPTYTEIGLVQASVRAATRDERLHPSWEQRVADVEAMRAATPTAHTPTRLAATDVAGGGNASSAFLLGPTTPRGTHVVDALKLFTEGTKASFNHARLLDESFLFFLRFIAASKLGVIAATTNGDAAAAVIAGRSLATSQQQTAEEEAGLTITYLCLRQLQLRTSDTARQDVWTALRNAAVDPANTLATLPSLVGDLTTGNAGWAQLAARFAAQRSATGATAAVRPYTPAQELSRDGKSLLFVCKDDSVAQDRQLLPMRHPTKANVYPVDVIPIFPSNYEETVTHSGTSAGGSAATALAGDAKGLTRLTMLGCTRRPAGYHLVSDGELFESCSAPTLHGTRHFASIVGRRHRNDRFESIQLEDGVKRVSTSSVLFHVCQVTDVRPADAGADAATTSTVSHRAFASDARRVALYNVIPKTNTMRRHATAREDSPDYVVSFDERVEPSLKAARLEQQEGSSRAAPSARSAVAAVAVASSSVGQQQQQPTGQERSASAAANPRLLLANGGNITAAQQQPDEASRNGATGEDDEDDVYGLLTV